MVQISGGSAPNGVEHESAALDDDEAAAIERWCEELVMRAKREVNARGEPVSRIVGCGRLTSSPLNGSVPRTGADECRL